MCLSVRKPTFFLGFNMSSSEISANRDDSISMLSICEGSIMRCSSASISLHPTYIEAVEGPDRSDSNVALTLSHPSSATVSWPDLLKICAYDFWLLLILPVLALFGCRKSKSFSDCIPECFASLEHSCSSRWAFSLARTAFLRCDFPCFVPTSCVSTFTNVDSRLSLMKRTLCVFSDEHDFYLQPLELSSSANLELQTVRLLTPRAE